MTTPKTAAPKSSTTLALLDMLHDWSKGTDGNSVIKRTVLFDYRKDFDLIDHSVPIRKLSTLDVPNSIVNWIIDFCQTDLRKSNLVKDMYLSLRSWRYCVGARLKFWRRSRLPKKGSRDEVACVQTSPLPQEKSGEGGRTSVHRLGRGG